MKPAEAADELRALTALHIANPKRIVALEMAIKRLNEDAVSPVDRAKRLFHSLSKDERAVVAEGYCLCCWAEGACECLNDEGDDDRE